MDQKNEPTQPQAPRPEQATSDEQKMQSRRQFVARMARRTAYIAPAVIALSASKSAFGSGGSGVS
jgi:hypothetical protein